LGRISGRIVPACFDSESDSACNIRSEGVSYNEGGFSVAMSQNTESVVENAGMGLAVSGILRDNHLFNERLDRGTFEPGQLDFPNSIGQYGKAVYTCKMPATAKKNEAFLWIPQPVKSSKLSSKPYWTR
jgi:hypothetical protein